VAFGLKGGIGTASRKLANGSIVGALVQTNFGGFPSIAGAPVGVELGRPFEQQMNAPRGSVMIIIVTDAAVDSRNPKRLAARAMLGLGPTGAAGSNGSGDYAIAFSTSPSKDVLGNDAMSPLFLGAIETTEEAIYNSLFRATTMTGRGHTVEALPIDKTLEILRKHEVLKN
jgi:D-aminopeptidase